MHVSRNRLRALVLAICLLFSVAIGSVALAAGETWVKDSSGNGGEEGSLTIKPAGDATAAEYKTDLASANLVADVYLMAPAEKVIGYDSYTYTLTDEFASLQSDLDACIDHKDKNHKDKTTDSSLSAWKAFAQKAADATSLQSGTVTIGESGGTVSNLKPGLYLVLPHGSDISDSLTAKSDAFEYTFDPIIVAIPNKGGVNGESVTLTSDDAEWDYAPTIYLKSSRERLYGSVEITKEVEGSDGKEASFVFHITETAKADGETNAEATAEGRPYDEYAMVYYDGETATPALVTKIPAGITVKITEVDAGPRYDADTTVYTEVIKADDGDGAGVTVSFKNTHNDNHQDGYGIENHFEHDGNVWKLKATPGDANEATN